MNELKEIYDIELSAEEKKKIVIEILMDRYYKEAERLEKISHSLGRIQALSRQEAIVYVIEKLNNERF